MTTKQVSKKSELQKVFNQLKGIEKHLRGLDSRVDKHGVAIEALGLRVNDNRTATDLEVGHTRNMISAIYTKIIGHPYEDETASAQPPSPSSIAITPPQRGRPSAQPTPPLPDAIPDSELDETF